MSTQTIAPQKGKQNDPKVQKLIRRVAGEIAKSGGRGRSAKHLMEKFDITRAQLQYFIACIRKMQDCQSSMPLVPVRKGTQSVYVFAQNPEQVKTHVTGQMKGVHTTCATNLDLIEKALVGFPEDTPAFKAFRRYIVRAGEELEDLVLNGAVKL